MGQHFPFGHFLSKNTEITSKNNNLNNFFTPSPQENPQDLGSINNIFLENLESELGIQKFSTFFKDKINIIDKKGDNLVICELNEWQEELALGQYKSQFDRATQAINPAFSWSIAKKEEIPSPLSSFLNAKPVEDIFKPQKAKEARFTLDLESKEDKNVTAFEPERIIKDRETIHYGQAIDPQKTLDNFVVGPSNNLAFATAHAVAASPGKTGKYPCLYIYSDSGLGKTHLLHAVANAIKEKYPEQSICLISSREFLKELIDAFKDKKLDQFQKKYCEQIDVLMIDDIHELKNKAQTQNEFFHIFNELHARGKQLIFTSDKDPQEIDGIEDRIITRLQWGLVADIQKPDLETRIAILKKKALELDLFLPDDVLSLIAVSVKSSIRELEGCLVRLMAMADVMNIEIDVEMAKDILKLHPEKEAKKITIDLITKSTANYFRLQTVDLQSKSRSQSLVKARHIAWYLCKKLLNATYKEIAAKYGNRDHSSVIHGVQKISERLKSDSELSKDVIYLENNL